MADILLIHQHPTIRHTVERYLTRLGHSVTGAPGARAALECASPDFDLVIADIALPGMGFLGLVDGLRARGLCPAVILTSAQFPHTEEAAAADFVLFTPFDADQLAEAVVATLGTPSVQQRALVE